MHAHCALACLNIFYKASLLRIVFTLTPVPRSVSSPETESGDNCLCGCQARAECDQWPMAPGGDCGHWGWHGAALSSQASARPRQVSRTAECRAIYYTQVNNQANRSHFFDDQRSKPSCHCLECCCDCCVLLHFYISIINPW